MRGSHVHAAPVFPLHYICGLGTRLPTCPSTLREGSEPRTSGLSPHVEETRARRWRAEELRRRAERQASITQTFLSLRDRFQPVQLCRGHFQVWESPSSHGGLSVLVDVLRSLPGLSAVGVSIFTGPLMTVRLIALKKETRARARAHKHLPNSG